MRSLEIYANHGVQLGIHVSKRCTEGKMKDCATNNASFRSQSQLESVKQTIAQLRDELRNVQLKIEEAEQELKQVHAR